MTLIDRLRTGTQGQAVGLLREVQEAVKPEPGFTERSTSADVIEWTKWKDWKQAFWRLLQIGTPEACVGAAMMLIPEGWGVNLSIPEKYDAVIRPAGIISKPVTLGPPFIGPVVALANVPALALAAAIMETRNV